MKEIDIEKEAYVSPECEIVRIQNENIICASRNDYEQETW